MKIILASSSIGRKKILKKLGLKFKVIPANIDEEKFTAPTPLALVKKIAKAKATAVAKRLGYNVYSRAAGRPPIFKISDIFGARGGVPPSEERMFCTAARAAPDLNAPSSWVKNFVADLSATPLLIRI